MNSLKQALNHFKQNRQNSFLLGILATSLVVTLRYIPLFSAFLISLVALLLQDLAKQLIVHKKWPVRFQSTFARALSYMIVAVILLPTSVLLGSAVGFLESPQELFVSVPFSLSLIILGVYFYLILSHALRFHFEQNENLAKSIDFIGVASFKNLNMYVPLSLYLAVLILIGGMTKGAGLIVALPFLFYVNHFSYKELEKRGVIVPVP